MLEEYSTVGRVAKEGNSDSHLRDIEEEVIEEQTIMPECLLSRTTAIPIKYHVITPDLTSLQRGHIDFSSC